MSSPSLHEAYTEYRDAMIRARRPKGTINQYTMAVRRLVERYPGRRVGGITSDDLYALLYGEQGICHGKAPNTNSTTRTGLRSFFRYAQRRKWTKTTVEVPNPDWRETVHKSPAAPTRLTEDELLLMLERTREPIMRCLVAAAMSTALRISDLRKIQLADVQLGTGELHVWVQKTKRFDCMPITLDLDEEIRRYMGWYTSESGVRMDTEGAYLLPGWKRVNAPGTGHLGYAPDPYRPCSYMWTSKRLHDLFADCGIRVEKREAWHVIRRSIGRIYFDRLREEVSHDHALRQTMALLGHKNVETTERYLGMQAEIQARNASMRGRRFFRASNNVTPITRAQ